MLNIQEYKALLSVAIRATHAAQIERYIRTGQHAYPNEYRLSPKFYNAVYIAACDSVIVNVNKLYNPDNKSITLYSIMHEIHPESNQAQYQLTKDMQAFIKQHETEIEAIRKIRNQCVAHLSLPTTANPVQKCVVEEMAEYAYDYIREMCLLQHGTGFSNVPTCGDIECTWKQLKEDANGKT